MTLFPDTAPKSKKASKRTHSIKMLESGQIEILRAADVGQEELPI